MRLQRWFLTLLALMLLSFGLVLPTSDHASAATTDQSVTFKIKIPDAYAKNPKSYFDSSVEYNGSEAIYVIPDKPQYDGGTRYWVITVNVSFSTTKDGYILMKIPKLDWSKSDFYRVAIETRDFIFPYKITKADLGKTILAKPGDSYVALKADIPFAGSGSFYSMDLCFTDNNGYSTNCAHNLTKPKLVPVGKYNFFIEASNQSDSFGLTKINYSITKNDPVIHFNKNNIAKITTNLKGNKYGLKLESVFPENYSYFRFSGSVDANGKNVYLSKGNYDDIIYYYDLDGGKWNYQYYSKQKNISKDTTVNFDTNLSLSINNLKSPLYTGQKIDPTKYFFLNDGYGNNVEVNDTQDYSIGLVEFKNLKTGQIYKENHFVMWDPFNVPKTAGNYSLSLSMSKSIVPIKPKTVNINIQAKTQPVSIKPVLKDGKFMVNQDDITKVKENSLVTIDLKSHPVTDSVVHLTKNEIQNLVQKKSNITVQTGDAAVTFPYQTFSGKDGIDIELNKLKPLEWAVTPVVDFNLMQGSKMIHHFDYPVTISLKVTDMSKVKDPSNLRLFYFNTKTKKWELIGGHYSNGYITADTTHFSTYSVFDTSSKTKGTPVIKQSALITTPPSVNTTVGTSSQQSSTGGQSSSQASNTHQSSTTGVNQLPNTATNTYNWLLLGGVLILLAAGMAVYQGRKKRS